MWPILLLFFVSTVCHAADLVIVVDTSGSMKDPISRTDRRVRLATVQQALESYLNALPEDTRIFLISFNTGIASEKEVVLRGEAKRREAVDWVRALQASGDTWLWTTVQRALKIASEYARQNPDQPVLVRILTDGQDTQRVTTLDEVLKEFPLVNGESIQANLVLLGDIEMKVAARKGFVPIPIKDWKDIFPPVIQWAPSPPRVGQKISFFDNSQSVYQAYEWLIDGKSVGNQKVLTHQFEKPGRYTVTLKVAGADGRSIAASERVTVGESDLTVDFVVSISEIAPQQEVSFFGRPTGNPTAFVWYVDGKEAGASQDFVTKFDKEGDYEVKLLVRDASGGRASRMKTISVREPETIVAFKCPAEVVSGQTVQFVNESVGRIASFEWEFGDGQKSAERNPAHKFTNEGQSPVSHSIVLRVTTAPGKTVESDPVPIRVVPISKPPPPQAAFRILGEQFKAGLRIQLMDESKGMIDSYVWDFGGEGTSSEKNPEFAPASAGEKVIRQIVTGPGGSSTNEQKIVVVPRYVQPTATLSASPAKSRLRKGQAIEVAFKAEISGDYDKVKWEFGDGATSSELNPTHSFAKEGTYTARLTARNAGGQEGQATVQIEIKPPRPWWHKAVLIVAIIFAVWVLVIVPFFLKPAMMPHKNASIAAVATRNLRMLARQHGWNWLWPRGFITIGTQRSDDIKVSSTGSAKRTMAVIKRTFATENYTLIPRVPDTVKLANPGSGSAGGSESSVPVGRGRVLRDGDKFQVLGESFTWIHPTARRK